MKNPESILLAVLIVLSTALMAQTEENRLPVDGNIQLCQQSAKFRLYPTRNNTIFIKLNTQTGQMWQVQVDLQNKEDRSETVLHEQSLVDDVELVNDRFFIYPTVNSNVIILMDHMDGRVWQVQWAFNLKKRSISLIEME